MIEMNRIMERFIEYALFDDIGDLAGIKDDAPEEAKKAYSEFMQIQEQAKEEEAKI